MAKEQKPQRLWQTVPGILAAIAGVITAVAGLIVALHQAGFFDSVTKQVAQGQHNTTKSAEPIQPPAAPGTGPGVTSPGEAILILHNNTQMAIGHVYFGTAQWGGWSGEQLSDRIPPGGTYTWKLQPGAGIYDLKAEDSNHEVLDQRMGVPVRGTYDWYVGGKP